MSINRREFVVGAAAVTGALALPSLATAKPQHQSHIFLTSIGIDSSSAPEDLTAYWSDVNRSNLHVAAQGKDLSFDVRHKGGQTQDSVNKNLKTTIIKEFGAKPLTPNGAVA